MLRKNIATLVEKYSFIDKAEVKGSKFFIYYHTKDKEIIKKIPIRTTPAQLQKIIKKIETKLEVSKYGKGNVSDIYTT